MTAQDRVAEQLRSGVSKDQELAEIREMWFNSERAKERFATQNHILRKALGDIGAECGRLPYQNAKILLEIIHAVWVALDATNVATVTLVPVVGKDYQKI